MKTRILLFLAITQVGFIQAREYPLNSGNKTSNPSSGNKVAAACAPGSGRTDLDLNNVRALIFTSGDMWWNLSNSPQYEVPKGGGRHSEFAASLWIGGLDNGGNLKSAAMTYRSGGNDLWPGPLRVEDASVTSEVCLAYDKHWKITRKEVEDFVLGGLPATEVINTWPGNGINNGSFTGYSPEMAPFVDSDGDGIYNPELRDTAGFPVEYPGYDVTGDLGCNARLFGDQTLWWVFNDKGNIHSETGGFPIGLEIRAQAFAFATNNALNNMTFYNYEIINRSTFTVAETYFGHWSDPDLGNYADDYAGCDVGRGLGFVYNGDEDDETIRGYGVNPPAIGTDFFEGPFEDADGIDNIGDPCVNPRAKNGLGYGDSIVDNERIGMARFIYYTSTGPGYANDPQTGQHIYNYLRGIWKDGTKMIYGGNGYGAGVPYSFMFPGDTDPQGIGYMITGATNSCQPENQSLAPWSIDQFSSVPPSDFRILQSAGPFSLKPGATNKVTVGIVWARASSGGRLQSVSLIRRVDDDAQALFDNCFSLINGPDAPQTKVVELDKELILLFENTNNNKVVNYLDNTRIPGYGDVTYKFQGYQIFQLKDLTVTVNDLNDVNRSRLVAQVDLQDSVGKIINQTFDQDIGGNIPEIKVNGENKGLRNSFKITTDLFATGNNTLINHKKYYFLVLSYSNASNIPDSLQNEFGESYLAGRRTYGSSSLQIYTGIPHINSPEFGGVNVQAAYGETPSLTRLEGQGNGGNNIDLTLESVAQILQEPYWMENPKFVRNAGPVNIKVVDPLSVPKGDFEFKILGLTDTSHWSLKYGNSVYVSNSTLSKSVEEVIADWGFSVTVQQVEEPGVDKLDGNGFITASQTFADDTKRWLEFLSDGEGCENAQNWIRSGQLVNTGTGSDPTCDDYGSAPTFMDPLQYYERILGGTWAPYALVSRYDHGPAYSASAVIQISSTLKRVSSVDIVFTPDKSKWSRCPVFETNDNPAYSQGGAEKLNLRAAASVNKDGVNDGSGTGMGWFPGYAINVETGERLNIAFGESSRLPEENGRDMKFNPSSKIFDGDENGLKNLLGGKHFIYVFNHSANGINDVPRYDEGTFIQQKISDGSASSKRNVFRDCIWVGIPIGVANQDLLSNDLKIRLRVTKPYEKGYNAEDSVATGDQKNANNPMFAFNTEDIFADRNNLTVAKSALDIINVVPNPYYAYSQYEKNQLDNRVKITNLPKDCKIRIYTTSGTLVRTFDKGDPLTSLDWDLKNQSGITVSSGIYLIHVNVPGVGEKIIKWFGVLRPIDLDTF